MAASMAKAVTIDAGSIGLRAPALDGKHNDQLLVLVEFEQDAPVADPSAKGRAHAAEKLHVSGIGVGAHLSKGVIDVFEIDARDFA
jgi:hypothetical protein